MSSERDGDTPAQQRGKVQRVFRDRLQDKGIHPFMARLLAAVVDSEALTEEEAMRLARVEFEE